LLDFSCLTRLSNLPLLFSLCLGDVEDVWEGEKAKKKGRRGRRGEGECELSQLVIALES
jgi:hypothetical protein